jgi:hypothetical protein
MKRDIQNEIDHIELPFDQQKVWEGVASSLHKHKRRRRILFFIFLFLSSGTLGYTFFKMASGPKISSPSRVNILAPHEVEHRSLVSDQSPAENVSSRNKEKVTIPGHQQQTKNISSSKIKAKHHNNLQSKLPLETSANLAAITEARLETSHDLVIAVPKLPLVIHSLPSNHKTLSRKLPELKVNIPALTSSDKRTSQLLFQLGTGGHRSHISSSEDRPRRATLEEEQWNNQMTVAYRAPISKSFFVQVNLQYFLLKERVQHQTEISSLAAITLTDYNLYNHFHYLNIGLGGGVHLPAGPGKWSASVLFFTPVWDNIDAQYFQMDNLMDTHITNEYEHRGSFIPMIGIDYSLPISKSWELSIGLNHVRKWTLSDKEDSFLHNVRATSIQFGLLKSL